MHSCILESCRGTGHRGGVAITELPHGKRAVGFIWTKMGCDGSVVTASLLLALLVSPCATTLLPMAQSRFFGDRRAAMGVEHHSQTVSSVDGHEGPSWGLWGLVVLPGLEEVPWCPEEPWGDESRAKNREWVAARRELTGEGVCLESSPCARGTRGEKHEKHIPEP